MRRHISVSRRVGETVIKIYLPTPSVAAILSGGLGSASR
jgi:hypothetical protein